MDQNPVDVHKMRSSYGSSQTAQQFINCCAFYEFTKCAAQFINCANSQIAPNISITSQVGMNFLSTFYRRLADMLSRHSSTSYSGTLAWIRCTLSFSLLRSATMCIRGTRSILHRSNSAFPEMGLIAGPRDF